MIKIGDFSRLAHVSIKSLNHYDQMDLFKPAHIDRYTGYRYYTLGQLPLLNRILALKGLRFSLDQIKSLLEEDLSTSEIRGMLRIKKFELESAVQEEFNRLGRVENRLRQLESEDTPYNSDIAVKTVPNLTVLTANAVAPSEEAMNPVRESLINLLNDHLRKWQIKPLSPWFSIVDHPTYDDENLGLQIAVGVQPGESNKVRDWGLSPVKMITLPFIENMASVIHDDPDRTIAQAYTSIFRWAQSNGMKIIGPFREIYLSRNGLLISPDNFDSIIEIQCPVERASIPLSIFEPHKRKEKNMVLKSGFLLN